MKTEQWIDVLARQTSARKDGAGLALPVDAEVTVFVGLPGETLSIPRVTKIAAQDELLVLDDSKGERFIVRVEDVRAVKIDLGEEHARDRSAGFGKQG